MRVLMTMAMIGLITSCATRPYEEESRIADLEMKHMNQGVKYSGGDFDDRFKDNGIKGGYIYGIGKSIYPLEKGEQLAEAAAVSNAKFDLINSAPTMMESLVQKLISSEYGEFQEFSKKDISITKIKNLKGIQISGKDVVCKTRMEPVQGPKKYKMSRECRSIARVKMAEMRAAFDFTLSKRLNSKVSKSKIAQMMK